jgi:hypothetical protein
MTRTAHREMEMRNLVVPACFLLPARRIETAGGVFRAKAAFETMSLPFVGEGTLRKRGVLDDLRRAPRWVPRRPGNEG